MLFIRHQVRHAGLRQQHVLHIIEAGLAADEIFCGLERAQREDLAGRGGMGDGDNLVVTEEIHLMLARDGSAAHGVDADLLTAAALGLGVAAEYIFLVRQADLLHCVCNQQRSAGGRVYLGVVVLFDDLDIELRQSDGGLAHEVEHHVDAERHIGGFEDRDLLRGLADGGKICLLIAGRGQHKAHLVLQAEFQQSIQRVRAGKIHHHICGLSAVLQLFI